MHRITDFSKARVLVVGDVMLDRYWHGFAERISPEAPVPIVHIKSTEERAGGAANVARNIAALGADATLIGIVGDDEPGASLRTILERDNIRCRLIVNRSAPTITKLRVVSRQQQLIRLDFEDAYRVEQLALIGTNITTDLPYHDVVIFSDYGKGSLDDIQNLVAICNSKDKIILVDPKGTNWEKYRCSTILTPNSSEFEAVVGKCVSDAVLVERSRNIIKDLDLKALLVTRGEHGMTLVPARDAEIHIPTEAKEVFDVTGAGDTVISVLGACLAAGNELEQATRIANVAAGIVVGKLGTAVVSESELRLALKGRQDHDLGVLSQETLFRSVAEAKQRGERVVMTNGCFDILHPGHVSYLEQAKQLGDRLLVAVNDDESVRRLKGTSRPINTISDRMAVLAGLASVDWVVSFSEDTPERIICGVLPDILVKGGDYTVEQIAGHECVLENGGRVEILPFLEGKSTSAIIKKIVPI